LYFLSTKIKSIIGPIVYHGMVTIEARVYILVVARWIIEKLGSHDVPLKDHDIVE